MKLKTVIAVLVLTQATLFSVAQVKSKAVLKSLDSITITQPILVSDAVKSKVNTQQIDEKWIQELYNNSYSDSIYKAVEEAGELQITAVSYPELHTDTLKSRLERLNAKTPFNIAYNETLEKIINQFLSSRRNTLERLIGLSHFYFPLFEEVLDKYNIPLEIKYLAIVESALNPRAKSKAGATGLWQFMYETGKMYGLDVSSYVDERSDPIMSTEAAAKYLSKLYEIFGDWDLSLAAYNSGPGNVSKAIKRSGGYQNYWNLRSYLPSETAGYVPLFLATMYVFEYAKEHGLIPEKPPLRYFETDTLRVKQMISLDQVSEATKIPIETLQFLNPTYKLDIIPIVNDENYVLRLPLEAIGEFVSNESTIYQLAKAELDEREKPLPQFFETESKLRYKVKSGDYLGKIARDYGVRVSQIKQWNGLRSNQIKIGQQLTIYPRHNANKAVIAHSKNQQKDLEKTYKVKSGDSLWSIAQKFSGISVKNLQEWNDFSGNSLKPGMVIKLSK